MMTDWAANRNCTSLVVSMAATQYMMLRIFHSFAWDTGHWAQNAGAIILMQIEKPLTNKWMKIDRWHMLIMNWKNGWISIDGRLSQHDKMEKDNNINNNLIKHWKLYFWNIEIKSGLRTWNRLYGFKL